MKTIKSILFGVLAVVAFGFISGCNEEPEGPTQTVWEIVQANESLSSLEAELMAQGLDNTLNNTDGITLFAPSNSAMDQLLGTLGLQDFSPVRADVAQAVLTYHVLAAQVMAADLSSGSELTTLMGENITVVDGPKLSTGASADAGFDQTDIQATNGVVHIVDVVLVPPTIGAKIIATLNTIAQPIVLSADFSILADAIAKADTYAEANTLPTLTGYLIDNDDYTVFAPPNSVFNAGSITVDTYTAEQWYGIIAHHVVAGLWTEFTAQETKTSMLGQTLTVLTTSAPTDPGNGITSGVALDSNGDAEAEGQIAVEQASTAGNGVVHALAGVLVPPM